jgi:hypothetical protein
VFSTTSRGKVLKIKKRSVWQMKKRKYVDPNIPAEGDITGEVEDTERDSMVQMTDSGEVLSGDDILQPRDADAGTVPRIKTDNL